MQLIKMGTLNFTDEDGEQGVRFVPNIVLKRLKRGFPELIIDEVDIVTKRIQLLENEIKNTKEKKRILVYTDMVNQEKIKLLPIHLK